MQQTKQQDIIISQHTSLNGKPLDFSFKNLENISGCVLKADLKYMEPRQGKRKALIVEGEENND